MAFCTRVHGGGRAPPRSPVAGQHDRPVFSIASCLHLVRSFRGMGASRIYKVYYMSLSLLHLNQTWDGVKLFRPIPLHSTNQTHAKRIWPVCMHEGIFFIRAGSHKSNSTLHRPNQNCIHFYSAAKLDTSLELPLEHESVERTCFFLCLVAMVMGLMTASFLWAILDGSNTIYLDEKISIW